MPQKEKTILVVEDDRSSRTALVDKLRREKYHVEEEKNGIEGLEHAKKKHPDIIVLDIAMPHLDGITVVRRIREEGIWGKNVPIIILTNISSDHVSIRIRKDKKICYIIKTEHTVQEIVGIIKKSLGTHSNEGQSLTYN